MNSENIKKVTNQAIEQLVEALNAGHSEALTRYLGAIAKFRAYSFLNVLLILKQRPNAGRIAGYKTWQSLGRQVNKGEKGIMILAPMFRKPAGNTDESKQSADGPRLSGFRAVYVWDEQQTTGNELPQIGSVTGDPSVYLERLEDFVRSNGLELTYSDSIAPAKGMAEKRKITLLPGQSPAETFATLVHERRIPICTLVNAEPIPTSVSEKQRRNPWPTWFAARLDLIQVRVAVRPRLPTY
jgi:hypothetical protein